MKTIAIASAGLLTLALLAHGILELAQAPEADELFRRLGYPAHVATLLAAAKLLGFVAFLAAPMLSQTTRETCSVSQVLFAPRERSP